MGFKADVLRVLIASPSDVDLERDEVEAKINEWNKLYANQLQIVLLPGRWEDDVIPTYRGGNTQQIINEQLVETCDIVIGIFWTKLGTATENYPSGTLEEVDFFIRQGKEVLLYFVDKDIPRNFDLSQVQKVDQYKREYGSKGIYATYNPSRIVDHLYRKVVHFKRNLNGVNDEPNSGHSSSVQDASTAPEVPAASVVAVKEPETESKLLKLFDSDLLNTNEILLLAFILNSGIRDIGSRWMAEMTLTEIKKWETARGLNGLLSDNYESVISNLLDRELLVVKETTKYGNPRLLNMPLSIYDNLRTTEVRERIERVTERLKTA